MINMSDEIDIEEHDVMDNPTIRRIFPDLSVIKEEINQYYEDGFDAKSETIPKEISFRDKIEFESPLHQDVHEFEDSVSMQSSISSSDSSLENKELFASNMIILGSKPSLPLQETDQYIKSLLPKVVLENVSHHLNKSKKYCKSCYILYPNITALCRHIETVHKYRSDNLSDVNSHKIFRETKILKKYKCDICSNFLSSRGNLIRHLKNIHEDQSRIGENNNLPNKYNVTVSSKVATNTSVTINSKEEGHSCFHCQLLFPNKKLLIEHLYNILEPNKTEAKKKRKIDHKRLQEKEVRIHENKCTVFNNFECTKCAIKFQSQEKLNHHDLQKHILPPENNLGVKKTKLIAKDIDNEIVNDKRRLRSNKIKGTNIIKSGNNDDNEGNFDNTELEGDEINQDKNTNLKTPAVKQKCYKCKKKFYSKDKLERHIRIIHRKQVKAYKRNFDVHDDDKKILVEKAYKCSICSHHFITFNSYERHMTKNHYMKKVPRVKKVLYDAQCKFCSSKLVNLKSYNVHIIRYHEEKLKIDHRRANDEPQVFNEIISKENDSFAFKSILYKCIKCDTHFLTANYARNHLEHMEVLINWKCLICHRIFKKVDKFLHVKQHSISHAFAVYELCESSLSRVLYNCPKCAVHFNENSYVQHYSSCGVEVPSSVYCKVCDLLIYSNDFESHDQIHRNENLQMFDFTIVETDFIINEKDAITDPESENDSPQSKKDDGNKIIHDNSRFLMTFCPTCECFVSYLGSTRKVHVNARCTHMQRVICKECGLVFTQQSMGTHRRLHKKVKGLNIQNYFFFDLETKQQMCPPLPIYPNCKICKIHFLSKNDVIFHECSGFDFIMCPICQIKFSKVAYGLHTQFHQYSMESVRHKSLRSTKSNLESIEVSVSHASTDTLSALGDFELLSFLYTCLSCRITLTTYDSVVKHCQGHYDDMNAKIIKTKTCQHCSFNFDENCYKIHEKLHNSGKYDKKCVKMVNFDPFYFCFENSFWIKHIYGTLKDDTISKVLEKSIYASECRLKMEICMPGPSNVTFYKCEKCENIITPDCLYSHAENFACKNLRKYFCSKCELCFVSMKQKNYHDKIHESKYTSIQPYKLIIFNMVKDQAFHNTMFKSHKQFIVHQCRNCNVVVEKCQRALHVCCMDKLIKCIHCGLIFHKQNMNMHLTRHKVENFNAAYIVVVLFGKNLYQGHKKVVPSFRGTVHDYTFYKCKECELCLKSKNCTFKHKCVFDDSKSRCGKCNLYFLNEELTSHALIHEMDADLEKYNINIITFDGYSEPNNIIKKIENKENSSRQNAAQTIEANDNGNITINREEKRVKIFKCDCGLHFLNESNSRKHYDICTPKMKISKQHCSKCGLLFVPSELFNHLLAHHGDKKLDYTFDIACISKKDINKKIYKCAKCDLHFLLEGEVHVHLENCTGLENIDEHEKCESCDFTFQFSSFKMNNHSENCQREYEVDVIKNLKKKKKQLSKDCNGNAPGVVSTILTDGDMVWAPEYSISRETLSKIDLSKYNNVIYRCNACNVHFLTENTWRRHLKSSYKIQHSKTLYDVCDICGLKFSLQSLTKHNYVHHEKFNLKKDEFIIKNSDGENSEMMMNSDGLI